MIVVVDTNVLLKMAAARTRSPLFASWQAHQTAVAAKADYLITVDKDLYMMPHWSHPWLSKAFRLCSRETFKHFCTGKLVGTPFRV